MNHHHIINHIIIIMGLLENYSLSHYGPSSSTMVSKYRKWAFNHDQSSTLTGGKRKRSRGRKDNNNMLLKSVLRHQQILHNNKYFVVGKGGDDKGMKNTSTTRRTPLNTPLTPVNTDALRILQANMQARDNEILQMLGNLDFRIGQAERDAEIAVAAAANHQSPTTSLASPILVQHGPRQLSNAGSNANSSSSSSSSRTSSSPNEGQRAVIALNNQSPAASSSVTTPNADSTDDAYGEAKLYPNKS